MSDNYCPNINSCRMVSTDTVVPDEEKKQEYMNNWCRQDEDTWIKCKRFDTKKSLSFCPDFVVPDTDLTVDEIVDKFEEEN
ncbi:MAG: hypothetical protein ABFS05_01185 [Bacteroidota bacterium]